MDQIPRIPIDLIQGVQRGITVIDLSCYRNLDFDKQIGQRQEILDAMISLVEKKTRGIEDLGTKAAVRYEVEYANGSELAQMFAEEGEVVGVDVAAILDGGCNYTYWTPLMDREAFAALTDIDPNELRNIGNIVDVGAGSGDLIKTFIGWGVNPDQILGVDISPTSTARINELGCAARCGRFSDVVEPTDQSSLTLLSYFIDRDADQMATFERALQTMQIGGTLVLEGLFPCESVDPNGQIYANSSTTVTRGNTAEEDIRLVIDAWQRLAQQFGIEIVITKVGSGSREVYSRDGYEELSSDIIVAKRVS